MDLPRSRYSDYLVIYSGLGFKILVLAVLYAQLPLPQCLLELLGFRGAEVIAGRDDVGARRVACGVERAKER